METEKSAASELQQYSELAMLRLMVETILIAMPSDQRSLALAAFESEAEVAVSEMLATPANDAALEAVQRAVALMRGRLARRGLLPTPPAS